MAISVSKTLSELQGTATTFGLEVSPSGKGGKYMKEDYILPIREYYLKKRYGSVEFVPEHLKMMLSIKSPMLARRIDDGIPDGIIDKVWTDENWQLEEKLNGVRILIIKDDSGVNLYSRHNSDLDLLPINYKEKILTEMDESLLKRNFILDAELTSDVPNLMTVVESYGVVTETILHAVTALLNCDPEKAIGIQQSEDLRLTFNIFDCLYYEDGFIMDLPLRERKEYLEIIYSDLKRANLNVRMVKSSTLGKQAFHKTIIDEGGEGTIAKDLDGKYVPDTSRKKDGWLKIKRSMSGSVGDTIDGWISGFEPSTEGKNREGLIGSLLISLYLEDEEGNRKEHCIAKISGFDMSLREKMTDIVEGIPTLKPYYYNKIVEIDGAGISPRALRFNHAVLLGFRDDKVKDDCVLDETFLKAMVL